MFTRLITLAALLLMSLGCGDDVSSGDAGAVDAAVLDGASPDAGEEDGGVALDAAMDAAGDLDAEAADGSISPDAQARDGGAAFDAGPPVPESCSARTRAVEVPAYDAEDPSHFVIASAEDWTHLDDADKRVFFVMAGQTMGLATISSSGTAAAPRLLVLYDGSTVHPSTLLPSARTTVRLRFDGAAHWIVDRLSVAGIPDEVGVTVLAGSHDIVLSRMHFEDFREGVRLESSGIETGPFSFAITVQQCRFESMSDRGFAADAAAVAFTGPMDTPWRRLEGAAVVESEFRDCNVGVRLGRDVGQTPYSLADYADTTIECNTFEATAGSRTDGAGNTDPAGLHSRAQGGVELQAGSSDRLRRVAVRANVFTGFRERDPRVGVRGGHGAAVFGGWEAQNVDIGGNVIFDCNVAFDFGQVGAGDYSALSLSVRENVLHDLGRDPGGGLSFGSRFFRTFTTVFQENTVSASAGAHWFTYHADEERLFVRCNGVVSSGASTGFRSPDARVAANYHYATAVDDPLDGPVYESPSAAQLDDVHLTLDALTGSPRAITLPGVASSFGSPHFLACAE